MKIYLRFSLFTLAVLLSINAYGFGKVGHATVAKIAERHLTPSAKTNIDKYLNGESIGNLGSWMDQVRKQDAYIHTDGWHTAAFDKNNRHIITPKKKKIYLGITSEIDKVKDGGYKNMTDSAVAVAIKLIVHMGGDMHCPSHIKFANHPQDKINFTVNGMEFQFHRFFDVGILNISRPNWTADQYVELLDTLNDKEIADVQQGEISEWIDDHGAKMINLYSVFTPGKVFDGDEAREMVQKYHKLEERQLQIAGYRLAKLLNSIFTE